MGAVGTDTYKSDFWKEYTDRNIMTCAEMEVLYKERYGFSRTEMNAKFISKYFYQDAKVLDVGSNIGNQLLCLREMGFKHLYGIDTEPYAVELSKGLNIIEGSAFDIPFKDNYFDYVMTSGLLIHINPQNINSVLDEIHRCSKRYIWGFEYYSEEYTEIPYRGESLWKADFAGMFMKRFDGVGLWKEKFFKHRDSDNIDTMFMLVKDNF